MLNIIPYEYMSTTICFNTGRNRKSNFFLAAEEVEEHMLYPLKNKVWRRRLHA